MAYDGELVKLENGRWARFSHLDVVGVGLNPWNSAILVAVELEERYQDLLDDAARHLDSKSEGTTSPRRQLRLESDAHGQMAVRFAEATVH